MAADRPEAGAIGVLTRGGDGTVYPSARKVPTYTEAVLHAFVSPFRPDNPWTPRYEMRDWDRRAERSVDWVSGSSMLLRRAALDHVGLFDEGYFMYVEDIDLCTRMRGARLGRVVHARAGGDAHRRHGHPGQAAHDARALAQHVPVLREAPLAGRAGRPAAAGVAGASGARGDRVAQTRRA